MTIEAGCPRQGGIGKVKRIGRVKVVSLLGVIALAMVQASAAQACSCRPRTPEQIIEAATVVVDGKVMDVARSDGRIAATISVTRIVKGRVGRKLVIKTRDNSAACGLSFTAGQIMRIAAEKLNDGLWTNLCIALPAPGQRR